MPAIKIPPRLKCAHLPTPTHKLSKLSKELGVELYIKRDDLSGAGLGGSFARQLDFLFSPVVEQKATCVVSSGKLSRRYCHAVSTFCDRLGLDCVLLLVGKEKQAPPWRAQLSAQTFYTTEEQYQTTFLQQIEAQIRDRGGVPQTINGKSLLGLMGYIQMWQELEKEQKKTSFDSLVFAAGDGCIQSGLLLGKFNSQESKTKSSEKRMVGVLTHQDQKTAFLTVKDLLWKSITQHRWPYSFLSSDIELLDGFQECTKEEGEFIQKIAQTEKILLDPLLSGKALYGLYKTLKKNPTFFGERVLFIQTEGTVHQAFHEKEAT